MASVLPQVEVFNALPKVPIPEERYNSFSKRSSSVYREASSIIHSKGFQGKDASSLANKIVVLSDSIFSESEYLELFNKTLQIRALDLAITSSTKSSEKLPELSLEDLKLPSVGKEPLKKALEFIKDPLDAITTHHVSLSLEDHTFSLPKETSTFFTHSLLGHSPKEKHSKFAKGRCSHINRYELGSKPVVLKTTKEIASHERIKLNSFLTKEACIYMAIQNPHITSPLAFSNECLWMAPADGNFRNFINSSSDPRTPKNLTSYLQQIATALEALHRLGITHQDVKTDNILVTVTNREIKLTLCDLGFGSKNGSSKSSTDSTPAYMSPSICDFIANQPPSRSVSTADDCWAFGICIYSYLFKYPTPFYDKNKHLEITNLMTTAISMLLNTKKPSNLLEKIKKEADRLIRKNNISLENLTSPQIKKTIKDASLNLSIIIAIEEYTTQKDPRKILFSKVSESSIAEMQKLDPAGFFQSLMIRCLEPIETRRITMSEILNILSNPPPDY